MALTINTNLNSINTQNQLSKSSMEMSQAMERLSSGLRINSAKDDAAGLAISSRFTAQINGLNQAVRNANDGISLAQTAEGAMSEMSNILQRMRELAVQSINDTNTASDRLALQTEVDQLYSELDRIASSTQFNGQNVLDGTLKSSTFQIGANAGQTLSVALESVTTQKLGLNGFTALGELNSGRTNTAPTTVDLTTYVGDATPADEFLVFDLDQNDTGGDTGEFSIRTSTLGGAVESLADIATAINTDASAIAAGISAEAIDGNLRITNRNGSAFSVYSSTTVDGAPGASTSFTDIGSAGTAVDVASATKTIAFDDVLINGEAAFSDTVTLTARTDFGTGNGGDSALTLSDAINNNSGITGVSAEAYNTLSTTALSDGVTFFAQINGQNVQATSASDLVNVINRDVSGLTATLNVDNSVTLSNQTGRDIIVSDYDDDGDTTYFGSNTSDDTASNIGLTNGTYSGYLALTSADGTEISVAANTEGLGVISDVQTLGFNSSDGSDSLSGSAVTSSALVDSDEIQINGIALGTSDGGSAADKAAAINAIKSETNVEASAFSSVEITVDFVNMAADDTLTINGTVVEMDNTAGTGGTALTTLDGVVAAINAAGIGGVRAEANADGKLLLSSSTGLDLNVTGDSDIFTSFVDQSGTTLSTTTTATTYTSTATLSYTTDATNETVLTVDGTDVTIAANSNLAAAALAINNANITGITAEVVDLEIVITESSASAAPTLTVAPGASLGDAFNLSTPTTATLLYDGTNPTTFEYLEFDVGADGASGNFRIETSDGTGVADTAVNIVSKINANTDLQAAGISAAVSGGVITITNNGDAALNIYNSTDGAGTAAAGNILTDSAAGTLGTLTAVTMAAATPATVNPVSAEVATVQASASGVITLSSLNGEDVRVSGADADKLGMVAQGGSTDVVGAGLSVSTAANAAIALQRIDDSLNVIDNARSALGAVQNRFESTISNLTNVSQNLTAARARIIDADFAVETTNLSRSQILQQAGTAMLAQANASQQGVLSLLG